MTNTSKYRLHTKYENIPLKFGSAILVNNTNITPQYAKQLLARPNGERFFSHIPTEEELAKEEQSKTRKKRQVKKKPLPHSIKKQASLETDDNQTLPNNEAQ